MNDMKGFVANNVKYLRSKKGLSQRELGERLHKNTSTVSHYEQGITEPSVEVMILMTEVFNVAIEDLILKDLSKEGHEPTQPAIVKHYKYKKPKKKDTSQLVNQTDLSFSYKENRQIGETVFVAPDLAIAGTPEMYFTDENLETVEHFRLPFLKEKGVYAAYQIGGKSMQDVIHDGDWVICRLLNDDKEVVSGNLYIIATKYQGVVLKRIDRKSFAEHGYIICYSDNLNYEPFELYGDNISRIWEVELFLSIDLSAKCDVGEQYRIVQSFRTRLNERLGNTL